MFLLGLKKKKVISFQVLVGLLIFGPNCTVSSTYTAVASVVFFLYRRIISHDRIYVKKKETDLLLIAQLILEFG